MGSFRPPLANLPATKYYSVNEETAFNFIFPLNLMQ